MANSLRRMLALILALNLYTAASASPKTPLRFFSVQPPWFRAAAVAGRNKPVLAVAMINRIDSSPSIPKPTLPCWHTVRSGESVSAIAGQYGTLPQTVVRVNSLKNPDYLQAGQRLYVTRPNSSDVRPLVVKKGDTVSELAKAYGLTTEALCKLNGIGDSDRLFAGRKIMVPQPMLYPKSRPVSRSVREPVTTIAFSWPVAGTLSSYYGQRGGRTHYGIDLAAPAGSPVRAAAAGEVDFAGWCGGYGLLVIINHGDGWKTFYGHNSRVLVSQGQHVERGQQIAEVGSTGQATGNHLHFEIRKGSLRLNPISRLPHN